MSETNSLELQNISKSFGAHKVLQALSLALPRGEVTLLLGANGSGKSTLLRVAARISTPDSGAVVLPAQARIGFSGHSPMLYGELTVKENLEFIADLANAPEKAAVAIEAWGLSDRAHTKLGKLSKGWQSRVGLCRAFMFSPEVLLLDEPTSALDEQSLELLCSMLHAHSKSGATILIATHDVTRLCSYAQRMCVLHQGQIACNEHLGPGGVSAEALGYYRKVNR